MTIRKDRENKKKNDLLIFDYLTSATADLEQRSYTKIVCIYFMFDPGHVLQKVD